MASNSGGRDITKVTRNARNNYTKARPDRFHPFIKDSLKVLFVSLFLCLIMIDFLKQTKPLYSQFFNKLLLGSGLRNKEGMVWGPRKAFLALLSMRSSFSL